MAIDIYGDDWLNNWWEEHNPPAQERPADHVVGGKAKKKEEADLSKIHVRKPLVKPPVKNTVLPRREHERRTDES